MNGRKLTQIVGFSVILWAPLAIVSVALENNNIAVAFLVLTGFSLVAMWVLSFIFLPEEVKRFQAMIGVYKPYLPIILVWAITVLSINLLTSPSLPISVGVLVIGLVLFIYIWRRTQRRNK